MASPGCWSICLMLILLFTLVTADDVYLSSSKVCQKYRELVDKQNPITFIWKGSKLSSDCVLNFVPLMLSGKTCVDIEANLPSCSTSIELYESLPIGSPKKVVHCRSPDLKQWCSRYTSIAIVIKATRRAKTDNIRLKVNVVSDDIPEGNGWHTRGIITQPPYVPIESFSHHEYELSDTITDTAMSIAATIGIIVAVIVGAVIVIILIVCCCCCKGGRSGGHVYRPPGGATTTTVITQQQHHPVPQNQPMYPPSAPGGYSGYQAASPPHPGVQMAPPPQGMSPGYPPQPTNYKPEPSAPPAPFMEDMVPYQPPAHQVPPQPYPAGPPPQTYPPPGPGPAPQYGMVQPPPYSEK